MKSIVLITGKMGFGGTEKVIANLATYFSNIENEKVYIVALNPKDSEYFAVPEAVSKIYPQKKIPQTLLLRILSQASYLRRTIKQIKPSVILSMGVETNILVLASLINSSIPIYISDRNSPNYKLSKIRTFIKKNLYKSSAGIICQTEYSKLKMEKLTHHQNIVVIANPVKLGKECKSHVKEKENVIINVGRLVKTKRQDKLIDLFSAIDNKEWKLLFVGGGHLLEYYKNYAQEKGLKDRIEFVGESDNVDYYLSNAKIFAFTSSTEGFPNALAEALLYPLPCISFDCVSGPGEMINDGFNGYLVSMDDDEQYIKKLSEMISDEQLRDKFKENAILSRERFALETICKKYYNVLTQNKRNEKDNRFHPCI